MADLAALGFSVDTAPLEKGTASLDKLAGSAAKAEKAVDATGASAERTGRQLSGSSREMERMVATAERISRQMDVANRSLVGMSGAGSRMAAEMQRVQGSLDSVRQATLESSNQIVAASARMEAAIKDAAAAQQKWMEEFARKPPEDPFKKPAESLETLRARYDPLFAIGQRYKEQVEGIRAAHEKGALGVDAMNAAISRAGAEATAAQDIYVRTTERLGEMGDRARLTSNQLLNLSRQGNDALTMYFSGSGIGQIVATQAGQIFGALEEGPRGLRGSLQAIGEAAKSGASAVIGALGPVGIAFGVVTAAAAAFAFAVRKNVPDATETLKAHEKVLAQVSERYEGVGEVLDSIAKRSNIGINIDLGATGRDLAEVLRSQVKQVEREFVGGGGFFGTLMFGTDDTSVLPAVAKLGPISDMLDGLRASFRETNPDVVALSKEIVAFNQSLDSAYKTAGDDTEMQKAIEAARAFIQPVLATATALDQNAAAATGAARATAAYGEAMDTLRGLIPDLRSQAQIINDAFAKASANAKSPQEQALAALQQQKALAADTAGAVELLNAARSEGASIGLGEEARAVAAVEQEYAKLRKQYEGNADALITLDQWRDQSINNAGSQAAFDREQEVNKEREAAAKRATDEAQRYAEATRSRIAGIDQTVAAQRMELDLFGQSEGAAAALRFEFQALSAAKQAAAAVGGIVSDAELAKIREAAAEVGRLTDQIAARTAAEGAVSQFFPMEAAAREAERLSGFIADTSNGLTDLQRQALGLQIDQGFLDAAEAAERLRTGGKKAAEDIGRSFIENAGDVFADVFSQGIRDGESFFDSITRGLAGIGNQLAAAGARNILGSLFGLPQDKSAAGIGGLIGQGQGYVGGNVATGGLASGPLTALNDNLAKTSRSALDVARQFAGLNEKADSTVLDGFLRASGNWKGMSSASTAWCAAFANAAIMEAGGKGTGSNMASSFLQWGMNTAAPKKGDIVVLRPQAAGTSGHVGFFEGFTDRGGVRVFSGNSGNQARSSVYDQRSVMQFRTAGDNGLDRRAYERATATGVADGMDRWAGQGGGSLRDVGSTVGPSGGAQPLTFGQTALGVLGAGAGIFSAGYQSGNPLMGGISGALGGFQAGAALFPALGAAGPIGAVAGAALGLIGGALGKRKQREQEHRQKAAAWEQMRPAYEAFDASLSGEGKGDLRSYITEQWGQLSSFMSTGGAAWKYGSGNSTAQFNSTGTKLFEGFIRMLEEFRDGFDSMVTDMMSGQGLQGAFAKGRNATKELAEQLKKTKDDIDIAFGNVASIDFLNTPEAQRQAEETAAERERALARFNEAASQYALSLLYQSETFSDVQQTIDGLRGTAAGLVPIFKDLGWNADDAAQAINDRLNAAIANIARELEQSVSDRIADLSGTSYTTSIRQFLEEYEGLQRDFAAAGADSSRLPELFKLQAQAIVDGAELTGDAFAELVRMFPQLSGVVREFSATVTQTAKEVAQANLDAARSVLDRSYQAEVDRINDLLTARRQEASELESTVSKLEDFRDSIKQMRDSLKLDANLSTLNARDRVDEARRQFEDLAAKARAGDEDARSRLTGAASDYLTEAKAYYQTSVEYGAIFEDVNRVLETTAITTEGALATAKSQLDALKRQITLDEALLETNRKQYEAILGTNEGVKSLEVAFREYAAAAAAARQQGIAVPGNGGSGGSSGPGGLGDGTGRNNGWTAASASSWPAPIRWPG